MPLNVIVYGRPGCSICSQADQFLNELRSEYDFSLEKVNIDDDVILQKALCCQIPVITINGGNRVALRVTRDRLRRAFRLAEQRQNQSRQIQSRTV
jgi:glutaredoxin